MILRVLAVLACFWGFNAAFANTSKPTDVEDHVTFKPYSPWSFSYFNWAKQNVEYTKDAEAQLSMYNYVSINRRLGGQSNISVRPTFNINSAGRSSLTGNMDSSGGISVGDMYVQYANYGLALLPGEVGFDAKGRVYIPMSDSSKEKRMHTRLRGEFVFTKAVLAGVDVTYKLRPDYYIYESRDYINRFENGGSMVQANKQAELWHQLEFTQRMEGRWGFSEGVGYKTQYYYDVPSAGIERAEGGILMADFGVFILMDQVSFTAKLMNEVTTHHDIKSFRSDHKTVRLFRPDETQYSLMTNVRF